MSASTIECVEKILNTDFSNSLSPILLEAKSLELLYLFFSSLDAPRPRDKQTSTGTREAARLNEVKDLLDEVYANPPTLLELGRHAGMSRSKFALAFKSAFGISVGDYCLNQRMVAAKAMLEKNELAIGEVGFRVGYEHQSSFTAGYRKFFGHPPRRHCRLS